MMAETRGGQWFRAVALGLALVAAGCGGSETRQPQPAVEEQPSKGGTLVLGASQEPPCADWLAPCGNSSWGQDMMLNQTLPRAFDALGDEYRPSPLLAGEPTLEVGPPQLVTYRISPQAVWSDGKPITSTDFRYTWEQGKTTNAPIYTDIADVDDSDPKAAVVRWVESAGNWRDRFPIVLPSHLLQGKDRSAEMRDGYRFSGGPWMIDHWTKGQEIKLVPNPSYWGSKPHLDGVVFKIITDAAAYLAAYKTGQVDMIFIQGAQPEVAELKSLPDTRFDASVNLTFEFVMFNVQKPPVDSRPVRQALAFATDREAIVAQLSGPLMPGVKALQGFVSPGNRRWSTDPFRRYGRDLAKVAQLMSGDGWSKGPDGIWTKGGSRAVIELNTATGNRRRELTQQILQSQWREAGFETTVNNAPSPTIGGEWLPRGIFQAALFGVAPSSPDPSRCGFFCSRNIPTEANRFQGLNASRISSPALDEAWKAVQTELDDGKRLELHRRAQEILAEEVPVLPISPVVDIVVTNTAKVGGPVKADGARIFLHLSEWYCRSCR